LLLDEIRDMSVTRRNLNRSWTQFKIAEQERKLEQVSLDLNLRSLLELAAESAPDMALSRS